MDTIKGAALYLTASSRDGARSFSERRAELLSGKRSGASSLTANRSGWVQDYVAASDIEERMQQEAATAAAAQASSSSHAHAPLRQAHVAAAVGRAVSTAVTMAVGPDEPIDPRLLPPRRPPGALATPSIAPRAAPRAPLASPAARLAPQYGDADDFGEEAPLSVCTGVSALDRMAAFLNADPFEGASLSRVVPSASAGPGGSAPAHGRFITPDAIEMTPPPSAYSAVSALLPPPPAQVTDTALLDEKPTVGSLFSGGLGGDAFELAELPMHMPAPPAPAMPAALALPELSELPALPALPALSDAPESLSPGSLSPDALDDKPKVGSLFGGGGFGGDFGGGGGIDVDDALTAGAYDDRTYDDSFDVRPAGAAFVTVPFEPVVTASLPRPAAQPPIHVVAPPSLPPPTQMPAHLPPAPPVPPARPASQAPARSEQPALPYAHAPEVAEEVLPTAIEDWLEDLDSDVEELPGLVAESPILMGVSREPLQIE